LRRRHSGRRERGIVGSFGFRRRDVADGLEEPAVIEPFDPFQRGVLDGLVGAPRAAPVDDLGLVEAVDGLGQGVVIAVADAADGRLDAGLIKRIKEIAETRMRYGYRRIHVLLKREGWNVIPKRIDRLYKELGLQLRNKTPKRRVKAKLRDDRRPATRTNEIWAMDFVHDQLATGRKLRVLTIVDTFSRFSLGLNILDVRFNFRGADVVELLEQVGAAHGFPVSIRVDQSPEFVSRDLDLWAYQRGVTLDFSRPGKPTENVFIESFNGKFRTECLNAHWLMSLPDARETVEAWRREYNELRPHSATPISLVNRPPACSPR